MTMKQKQCKCNNAKLFKTRTNKEKIDKSVMQNYRSNRDSVIQS